MTRELPPRATRSFPTRAYAAALAEPLEAATAYRWVIGVDPRPVKLSASEVADLRDPFARLLLARGVFPMTMRGLLSALDADLQELPVQRSFLVGDGGHIPLSPGSQSLDRQLRFAVTRGRADEAVLMISAPMDLDSDEVFLQLLTWDPVQEVYNYYLRQKPAWVWSGNSYHALAAPSRGRGCFDSHVNGSLVMKELKPPWNNWHSMAAAIETAIAPDDPVRREPLFATREGAENLERFVVRPGIARWNAARLRRHIGPDGSVRHARWLMRQVLEATSVNLTSSDQKSALLSDDEPLRLPITFFFNADALLDRVELAPEIRRPSASARLYKDGLARYAFELTDGSEFHQPGDTHFAFLVPEPAFEDLDVLEKLLQGRVLSRQLAASLLMVDFPNPLASARRAALMKYVPEQFERTSGAPDFSSALARAITAAAPETATGSPEREVVSGLENPQWERDFAARLERYMTRVQERLGTSEGFDACLRLAESRRREFQKLPLAEFRLTVPATNIPAGAPLLQMDEDGTVTPKTLGEAIP